MDNILRLAESNPAAFGFGLMAVILVVFTAPSRRIEGRAMRLFDATFVSVVFGAAGFCATMAAGLWFAIGGL